MTTRKGYSPEAAERRAARRRYGATTATRGEFLREMARRTAEGRLDELAQADGWTDSAALFDEAYYRCQGVAGAAAAWAFLAKVGSAYAGDLPDPAGYVKALSRVVGMPRPALASLILSP